MKIYVHDHGVIIAGKAWEVREKLKEDGKDYALVSDWIRNHKKRTPPPTWIPPIKTQKC